MALLHGAKGPKYGAINEVDEEERGVAPSPEDAAGILSTLTFWWCNALIFLGYRRPLVHTDLPDVSEGDNAAIVSRAFEGHWAEELRRPKPSLVRALRRTFGFRFMLAGIPKLFGDLLGFLAPMVMQRIILWLDTDEPAWHGYTYAAIMFAAPFLQSLLVNAYFLNTFKTGMRVRAAIVATVYRKSLRLSGSARQRRPQGEIVNMQSNDAQRLMDLCPNFHLLWSAPLQIILALILLFTELGLAALVGVGLMLLLIPVQGIIASRLGKLRKELLSHTDKRVRITNEILQGIRVLKFYAWEQNFSDVIVGIRKDEVEVLTSQAYWRAYIGFFLIASPVFVSTATFAVYSVLGNELSAEVIFPALAYFNLLRFPLTFMPMLVIALVEAKISVGRLLEFFLLPELDQPQHVRIGTVHVAVDNASFSWDASRRGEPTLSNINLNIREGKLVMVVGPVGAGKSSLVSALLGSMEKVSGTVNLSGTVAYASQQAWIMNDTLRNNILFGEKYNEERYRATIDAACLAMDIKMLPAGDETEIGEKGINLSGGQKQRVSLARAIYHNSDILLLDDVLSAVDAHVGKHIFEYGILRVLKGKTIIFVTHQNHYLPHADHVVVMMNGTIAHQGTYEQLVAEGIDFDALLSTKTADPVDDIIDEYSVIDGVGNVVPTAAGAQSDDAGESDDAPKPTSSEKSPLLHASAVLKRKPSADVLAPTHDKDAGKLVEAEERETGVVSSAIYWKYMTASGSFWFLTFAFFTYVITEVGRVGGDLWLTAWSTPPEEAEFKYPTAPPFGSTIDEFFLWVYVLWGVFYCLMTLLRNVLTSLAGVNASKNMFGSLFVHVMHAPITFFDTTPTGRILNRFTKDLDNVDNQLPQTISQFLGTLAICISTLAVIAGILPLFLAALVPVMLMYWFVMQFYRRTSRELQRLDSISRSPIYTHFAETLSGVEVIRAYSATQRFIDDNEQRINYNQRAYWMVQATNRWLSLRLEVLGTLLTFASALFAVIGRENGLSSSFAGLSMTYALQVTGFLNWVVRMGTLGEAQMNAVERIDYYSNIETEAAWRLPATKPPASWPQEPSIRFANVYMRYRPHLPPSLQDVSFEIRSREKIGVVGRTGAGKSSLTLVLFRLVEIYEGSIEIDGIDISALGLHDLRERIAIIPQDPVLFSGTIRFNLDPFGRHSNQEMWRALELVHLREAVMASDGGLDSLVTENGANWSLGQRQLFCFARALLKNSPILVLDEATSSVDSETDSIIQRTIREQFADRTVITIAHRLSTVMDMDRILVLDKGRVVEFDTPAALVSKPPSEGILSSMVNDTGPQNAAVLRSIAFKQRDVFGATIADANETVSSHS